MNIGIFSGSFNPIHVGHLMLANYITEYSDLDEVWFVVTPQNPFKKNSSLLDEDLRLEMTKLAIENYSKLKVSDIEFGLPKPSYTINTLNALNEQYEEHTFSLIIGADNWEAFGRWKDHQEIVDQYNIYVYQRYGNEVSIPPHLEKKVEALDSPIIDVSSTFIRQALADEKNVQAFLPHQVYKFIGENKLYHNKIR